jgi:hypothetical protein
MDVRDPIDDQPYDDFAAHGTEAHHIGAYLAWLIRSGLVDEARFDADDLHALRTGGKSGMDLERAVGGRLSPTYLTDEGRRFSDFYYDRYLTEYDGLAAGDVVPPPDRIEALIDERYGQWVARGRPAGKRRSGAAATASFGGEMDVAASAGGFSGSTWVQIEQQKAELARTMHLAFRDDPSGGPAYGEKTSEAAETKADATESEEPSKPRWKFWR